MIGLVPQELHTDSFETVWATVELQPRPVRQAEEPGPYREDAARPVAVGQEGFQDHDAVRRHEAPRDDRQGPVARAAHPVPRRADRRRRCRAAQGHVAGGARPARLRRHHHPHHPLHRGSRGHGRPRRRDLEGRDRPGRGQGRADAQARQEAAHHSAAEGARRRPGRAVAPQARAVDRRHRTGLFLRHQGRAHRHHRAARRPQRREYPLPRPADHAILAGGYLRRSGRSANELARDLGDLHVRDGAHRPHAAAEHRLAGDLDLALFRGVRRRHRLAHPGDRRRRPMAPSSCRAWS